ncbi:TetR/AcrR family transcriptional regulator [Sporosarcina sp. P21c]|uniref:TetR family transcriptional regulator n=1 Tax=Sporosarcina TaxID=1569 RepID=UPI000A15ADD8|nr:MULTISPECIES: TetR family transcriptional regulator [Sporosarcina]ARJ39718.1 TetR family transcriptional regulator [Sporosarcina ureae]PIC68118.1 TetR/AcrR family transcriptional regulator [Sporosarcina sp. P16a]PIC82443.1 TetR/AcrR family transcriptional regulator [Sporosarcina sp. P1]PIC89037.1 TetR/AcrR family transcriptional regulator [Sporosarcina sp. P21c]PIC94427.1 TetR/AcrR family transcriptional regulator [Sporosarcina sp. P25]
MGKKTAIVHSAIEVFKEQGIEKTKISDIVKRAGIAQGTFYLYFPSKLSLMPAIAEVMVAKTMDVVKLTVDHDASYAKQFEQMVDAIYEVNKEYYEILAVIYSGLASTEHIREWESVYAPFYEWISEKLEAAKKAGAVRQSIKPDRTAKIIIGLIESTAEQVFLYAQHDESEADRQKEEVLDFLSHALQFQTVEG